MISGAACAADTAPAHGEGALDAFGGDILAWLAEDDINAGCGSKTTVLLTPPRRVYDDLGDVTLSPQAPSMLTGIGRIQPVIATLDC